MIDILIAITPLIIKLNILLTVAALLTFAINKTNLKGTAKQTIARAALLTALTVPFLTTVAAKFFEPKNFFAPPIQISQQQATRTPQTHRPTTTAFIGETQKPETTLNAALALTLLTLITAATRATRIKKDHRKLQDISDNAITLKHIGQTKIQISEQTKVPFATRLKSQAIVILPPKFSSLALKHELQHHRQGDLHFNKLLEAARLIAGWNPLVRQALERIEEFDELACDENLLGRGAIDVKRYARCLFETALASQNQGALAGSARMATSPKFLKRRIEMTLDGKKPNRKLTKTIIALTTLTLTATAWASEGLIKDRRITEEQAIKLVKKSTIPITINKQVLEQLNNATGTPRARQYMRNSLKRLALYKQQLTKQFKQAHMPEDLLAVPFVESGFQNVETKTSAGLWMFIPDTARRYGMQVDDVKDDRLDTKRETKAAIDYLAHLQDLFQGDWPLTLLSFNAGERNVQAIIDRTGERDVFKLGEQGKLPNEENTTYVPKVMAALIILRNPSLVSE